MYKKVSCVLQNSLIWSPDEYTYGKAVQYMAVGTAELDVSTGLHVSVAPEYEELFSVPSEIVD
jgi:hypothetical protein